MSKGESKPKTSDWTRCFEGFADLSQSLTVSSKPASVKRKSADNFGFGHGNIFEKLGLGGGEDTTSQSIVWSSSDSDENPEKKAAAVTPVVKKPRRGRARSSPKKPARSLTKSKPATTADAVEIQTVSDDESAKESSVWAGKTIQASGEEVSIAGFESGSEEIEPRRDSAVKDRVSHDDSQPCISSIDSQSPPPTVAGRKASNWIKSLQLKTPSKSEQEPPDDGTHDSVRKKKKHSKGGLAEQMSRLLARDRSSVRMWAHQQSKPSTSQDSRSSILTVISVESLYSMQLVRCLVSMPGSVADKLVPDSGFGEEGSNTRLVLFTGNQSDQLNLQAGTQFKIYPPWQQLELNDGQVVLLCTKYCQVQQGPTPGEGDPLQATPTSAKYGPPVEASWNCPCVQGLCRSMALCPASQFPAVAGHLPEATTSVYNQQQSVKTDLSKAESPRKTSHLQTISPIKHTRSLSYGDVEAAGASDSILKSIQGSKHTGVEPRDTTPAHNLKFNAHVHRHIVQCKKDSKTRHLLLLEDVEGHVGVVQLTPEMFTSTLGPNGSCEGRTLQFDGLSVIDRVTRDRDEALFTMVDHVWSGKTSPQSQGSSQSQNLVSSRKQDFCYVMSAGSDGPPSVQAMQSTILSARQQSYVPLDTLLTTPLDAVRSSVMARLIYIHKQTDSSHPCLVYITDTRLQKSRPYVTVPFCPDISPPDQVTAASGKSAILLRDLLLSKGGPQIDGYSQLKLLTPASVASDRQLKQQVAKLRSMKVPLKPFSRDLAVSDLCELEGIISEVDEDSAYSWEACVHCGSDQLKTDPTNRGFTCTTCNKNMTEGVTKMKMEVIVMSATSKQKAKIDLLQSTIERILPADEGDDEGYELSSVLNKHVGPLQCIVINTNCELVVLKEIHSFS